MVKRTIQPSNDLMRDWSSLKKFTDRDKLRDQFINIYKELKTENNNYYFMMYYGVGGIGKSALCDQFFTEIKKLDGFDENKKVSKNNKLSNFYAKINLEGGNFIHAEDFIFQLRHVIEINAKRYNKINLEFPIFDTCYSLFWKKRHKNIPLKEQTDKTGIGGILREIASILLDNVTMGMGGIITAIIEVGFAKIKENGYWNKRETKIFINRFSQLEVQKMEDHLPQALAIDIANILKENGKQLLIFVDTYEAIYGEISKHIDILKSGKLDSFFREFVIHVTGLTTNVSFFVFGREKIYWEEIDKDWAEIIETHLIGKLSDNDARIFLTNANIPTNLIDHIIKIAQGYPLYLDLSVDIYHNRVDDGEDVTESDFPSGHQDLVIRFLKYSDIPGLLKTLAIARKWNIDIFELMVRYLNLPVTIDYFYSLKKYSFISESGEFLSMHSVMREHIISYLLENENQQTVDLINKMIEYHSDFELKHPDEITPDILFHIEEKLYLERYIDIKTAIYNFYKYYNIIELGGYYAYLNDIFSDMITWDMNDNKLLSSILNILGITNSNLSDYDSALEYYEKSLKIREEIGDKAGIAFSLGNIGNIYLRWGKYDSALEYLEKSLKIEEEIGDKAGFAKSLNNIGNIYLRWGKYDSTLEYLEKSLKIREEIGDKAGIADTLNNIGLIYSNQGKYDRALEYLEKSLKMFEEIGDKAGIANSLNNIGLIYDNWGKYDSALEYYEKSLRIEEEIGDKAGIANSLNNIGLIYNSWGKYDRVLEYHEKSLKIREEIGDKAGIAFSLGNIGSIYGIKGDINAKNEKYDDALRYYHQALNIFEKISSYSLITLTLNNIGLIYAKQGKYDSALEYYEKSLKMFEDIGDKAGIAFLLGNIGNIYIMQNNLEKGKDTLSEALEIATNINNQGLINNIKQIFDQLNNDKN